MIGLVGCVHEMAESRALEEEPEVGEEVGVEVQISQVERDVVQESEKK